MQLNFSLTLPDELSSELAAACKESECSPERFVGQLLEAELATRRLPNVAQGANGARITMPEETGPGLALSTGRTRRATIEDKDA